MVKTLDQVINDIVNREGVVYTNKPGDRGGPTKFGITLATLHAFRGTPVDADQVKNLTFAEAAAIYRKNYIESPRYDRLNNPALVEQMIDAGVQHGVTTAIKILQKALHIMVSGALTSETVVAASQERDKIVVLYIAARMHYYADILDVTKNPKSARTQWQFAAGWLNRMGGLLETYGHEIT